MRDFYKNGVLEPDKKRLRDSERLFESEEVYKRDSQIDTMNNEMQNLRTEIREFERRIQKAEDECKAYRRIIERIYVKE